MRQLKIKQSITSRDSRALEKYLYEISHTEPLTIDEEVELAQRIHQGGKDAQNAINRLVSANLRFVVSVAKQYQNQGLSLEDLVNEGNIGMITAAHKYDETRGFKFISYAVWWIRQAILLALGEQSRMVRIPLNRDGLNGKIAKVSAKFEQKYQRRPTNEELAEELNVPISKIIDATSLNGRHISVDAPFADGEDHTLLDVIGSDDSTKADLKLNQESLSTELNRALTQLPSRESDIVKMSFGIGGSEMTLDEISEQFNLSRERVRQIKEKAIRKLRSQHDNRLLAYL